MPRTLFEDYLILMEQGLDVVQDVMDTFWENPLAFACFVHARYREPLIDVFARRVYEGQPSRTVMVFRKVLKRERIYDSNGVYSTPIGSRYHPERAPLWDASGDVVPTTEGWMREN